MIREVSEQAFKAASFMPSKNLTDARDFVEMRRYCSRPGVLDRFPEIYAAEGFPVQVDYLGHCLGYFRGLDGPVDEVVHLWGTAISTIVSTAGRRYLRMRVSRVFSSKARRTSSARRI